MLALAVTRGTPARLELREAAEPADPPAGQVVLRVLASALNRGERSRLESAPDGHVFGWDVVGVVERVHGADSPVAPGDQVAALSLSGGGWAERVMVRQEDLGIIPKELSAAAAATIPVAGLTALRALRSCPNLLGATVLVVGGGAVAWYAVQLAVLGGARVVALVRSSESADRMRDLGAHGVIRDSPPPAADFDLVIDTVGGALTQVALAACRPFGRLVILGNVGAASAGLAPSALVAAGCLVQGYRLVVDATSTPVGRDLRNLLGWTASGRLQTPPVQEVSWHDSVRVGQAVAGQLGPARTVLRIADR